MIIGKKIFLVISMVLPLMSCTSKSGFSHSESNSSDSEEIPVVQYDEEEDSLDGVDPLDLSDLYAAFNDISSYRSEITSYFNDVALYDYYRYYQKNYIQESISLFDEEKVYSYSPLEEYFDSLNMGYLNKDNNYYSYFKRGNTIEERLNSSILDEDLTLIETNKRYQDDMFSLFALDDTYLHEKDFIRISKNKYCLEDKEELFRFAEICSPNLITKDVFMTFSKITIEINPKEDAKLRIRLYASPLQEGKLIESHKDEINKPNWYLLFSEAIIN